MAGLPGDHERELRFGRPAAVRHTSSFAALNPNTNPNARVAATHMRMDGYAFNRHLQRTMAMRVASIYDTA